jgi:hypothetical protein
MEYNHNLWILADRHFQAVTSSRSRNKGKQKAREIPIPESEASIFSDEIGSCPVTDESKDSDSEFQPEGQDEDDDEMMLDTAVRLSLQSAAQFNEAGPSSGRVPGLSPAVKRRAVSAERRLAAKPSNISDAGELEDLSDLSSEEYPLKSHAKTVVARQAKKENCPDRC